MASSPQINQWNDQWRQSPLYKEVLSFIGVDTSKPFKLSKDQRKFVQSYIEKKSGTPFGKGVEIDPSGNMNEDEGFSKHKKWIIPAAIAAVTAGLGAAGIGPLAGIMGGSGGAASASAAPLVNGVSTALPGAIASQGISAGVPLVGATAGSTGLGAGMSLWDKVLGVVKKPETIGAIGNAFSHGSQASAQNRGAMIEALIAQEELRNQREHAYNADVANRDTTERAAQTDAWKKLQQSSYISNWKPSTNAFSPYTRPLTAPAADVVAGAGNVNTTANQRLTGATSLPAITKPVDFTIPDDLTHGSAWEKIMGYLGAGAGAYGALNTRRV